MTLTIGAVPYLNAAPLVGTLLDAPPPDVRVVLATPRELARAHSRGDLDAAVLPVVELFRRPELAYVPGIAIATRGATDSVKLHHRTPVERIARVALDAQSLTTNALARVLLESRWRLRPAYVTFDPRDVPPDRLVDVDAAVTIGDASFRPGTLPFVDLGTAWCEWTGLPFVFAVWGYGRGHPEARRIESLLSDAKARGLPRRREWAERQGRAAGLSPEAAVRYLTESIRYDLGIEEEEGMARFRCECERVGALAE